MRSLIIATSVALLFILGAAKTSASPAPDAVCGTCHGQGFVGLRYHDCVDILTVTATIFSTDCGAPACNNFGCEYSLVWYMSEHSDCGGEDNSDVVFGNISCGLARNFKVKYDGVTVATAAFSCGVCQFVDEGTVDP